MADSDDDELADAVRELTRTLEALRTELEDSHRRRGPRFRPPTPQDVLAFTDKVAIPTALTVLKSSVRALEAFQRGLDLVRTEREVRDRTTDATDVASERANEVRKTTLSRLDTVLSELQRAASSGALPADEDARDLLSEARDLRDDVDARLRDATSDSEPDDLSATESSSESNQFGSSPVEIDIDDGSPEADDSSDDESDESTDRNPGSAVDVDAELETLKDQYNEDESDVDADASDAVADDEPSADDEPETDDTGESATGSDTPDSSTGGETKSNGADDDENDENNTGDV
ncbi:DUF7547 family protein [Natronolimnobius baerhuensis]|uniref:Uncharacterized protein n=1 Tax=Natronolimnobius baerhuensis TaxID=253108 RepID=A0A202ED64_9EURY|nr:hypothetical protein [Natronolimnobius baerhuensis]OVE86165.1 hypothetical protein B2G88_05075 [Natronolimnobius baerhuensis]